MELAPWAETICSVTDAALVESAWLVAVTVTGVVAETLGAVNSPEELTVPTVADQETARFGSLPTVAVNCWVPLAATVALSCESVTEIGSDIVRE
jgi:hypothetical protein